MLQQADVASAPRVTVEEAWRHYGDGTAIFVDTRPQVSFAGGHIPGAISMPLSEIGRRLNELPREKLIIFY
ncbi:MAG: hypothetical protein GX774_02070 [Armatimonadetes bacterium]|nr:hypothetical protein [Armatimonadota bacterium]